MVKFAKKAKKYKKTKNKITNNLNKKNNIIKSKYKKRIKTKLIKIKFVNPLFEKNSYFFYQIAKILKIIKSVVSYSSLEITKDDKY